MRRAGPALQKVRSDRRVSDGDHKQQGILMENSRGRRPKEILRASGRELPGISASAAAYTSVKIVEDLAYVSGHGPLRDGAPVFRGKAGPGFTVEDGQESAALTVLSLASLKAAVSELDRVAAVVKPLVLVNATEDFAQHHLVADGASELPAALFGEAGVHARSAIGVASLPFGIATEVEAIVRVR
jgi:enamine deaminase RidA (YjgF/YER057c/UK114 family)